MMSKEQRDKKNADRKNRKVTLVGQPKPTKAETYRVVPTSIGPLDRITLTDMDAALAASPVVDAMVNHIEQRKIRVFVDLIRNGEGFSLLAYTEKVATGQVEFVEHAVTQHCAWAMRNQQLHQREDAGQMVTPGHMRYSGDAAYGILVYCVGCRQPGYASQGQWATEYDAYFMALRYAREDGTERDNEPPLELRVDPTDPWGRKWINGSATEHAARSIAASLDGMAAMGVSEDVFKSLIDDPKLLALAATFRKKVA